MKNYSCKCDEQKVVGWYDPFRELPFGARHKSVALWRTFCKLCVEIRFYEKVGATVVPVTGRRL